MTLEPDHFTPEDVEEQLDQVEQQLRERDPALAESPTLQVIADLHQFYDPQTRAEVEAWHRVRHRLLHTSAAARYLRQAQPQPRDEPSGQETWRAPGQWEGRLGQRSVEPIHLSHRRKGPGTHPGLRQESQDRLLRLFRTGQRWSGRAMTLVAVALLAVLLGGLTLGLILVHRPGTGTVISTTPHPGAIREFALPGCKTPTGACGASWITRGPDGNLWFTEPDVSKIGRITPAGSIEEFACASGCQPYGITSGPDGNLWFADNALDKIGRITPSGSIEEFACAYGCDGPFEITSGPDDNLWFTENNGGGQIGRITPSGSIEEFALPTTCGGGGCDPVGITSGPDGNLWFTENAGNKIGRITPSGSIEEFALPTTCRGGSSCNPLEITSGPDGNLWFTEGLGNNIGRITPEGLIEEFALPSICEGSGFCGGGITSGPDGNLWFTEYNRANIGRITPSGSIEEFACANGCGGPFEITSGPDGNLWFTEQQGNKIGRISP